MTEKEVSPADSFGIEMPKREPRKVEKVKVYRGLELLQQLSPDAPKLLWKSTCIDSFIEAGANESSNDYNLNVPRLFTDYATHLVSNPYGPFIFYSFAAKKLVQELLLRKASIGGLPMGVTEEELHLIEDKLSILTGVISTRFKESPNFFVPGSKQKNKDQKVQESIEKCWAHIRMLRSL